MSSLSQEIDVESVENLRRENADFLLLDVREESEYEVASIQGSLLIPMSQRGVRVAELAAQRDRHIVVHCHHGVRSLQVADALRANGFSKVQSMGGGIDQWSLCVDDAVPRY